MNNRGRPALFAALFCTASCSVGPLTADVHSGSPARMTHASVPANGHRSFLYVAGHQISVYALGSSQPLQSSKTDYYVLQARIALDKQGDLCESNGNPSYEQVLAYDARTLMALGSLDDEGTFQTLISDRSGYLYGAGGRGIAVLAPGCTHVVNVIRPCAYSVAPLVFDGSGDLYAGNVGDDSVCVYSPEQKPGHMKFVRKIAEGVSAPDALAIGPSGELFVANYGNSSVSVFAAGASQPMRTITKGIDSPQALAVDSKGRLFVINRPYSPPSAAAWVSIYAARGTRPMRRIAGSDVNATAVALDGSNRLYVANATTSGGYVGVYSPGGAKLLRTISKGVDNPPMALLIGTR